IPIHGDGKKYKEQFDEFDAVGKRKLHIGQTIILKMRKYQFTGPLRLRGVRLYLFRKPSY
ncbi:MAG: hypothetical protein KBT21_07325, partial [Treponema sp.]|nr:hypothetical protein [Candidatus Treponema merdequi]